MGREITEGFLDLVNPELSLKGAIEAIGNDSTWHRPA